MANNDLFNFQIDQMRGYTQSVVSTSGSSGIVNYLSRGAVVMPAKAGMNKVCVLDCILILNNKG